MLKIDPITNIVNVQIYARDIHAVVGRDPSNWFNVWTVE